jgi:hypothetical protein
MRMLYWPLRPAGQRFKTVAGQGGKIFQRCGRLQTVKLQARGAFDPGECLGPFPGGEVPGALVPIADDH